MGPGSGLSSLISWLLWPWLGMWHSLSKPQAPLVWSEFNNVDLKLSAKWPLQCSPSSRVSIDPSLPPLPLLLSSVMPCGITVTVISMLLSLLLARGPGCTFWAAPCTLNTGWDRSRFTGVSTRNGDFFLYYHLLIVALFSIWTAISPHSPHPILRWYCWVT